MRPIATKSGGQGQNSGKAQAEMLAVQALNFIAADVELMAGFLGQSGLDPSQLRSAAGSPEFLTFVMDYICSGDEIVLAFAAAQSIRPEAVMQARHRLGGARVLESHE